MRCYTHIVKTLESKQDIAICIASGPSVTQSDIDYCRGKGTVYVVNEMGFLAPWADVLYCADCDVWDAYRAFPEFKGEKWTPNPQTAAKWGLEQINLKSNKNWGGDDYIASGGNSGFQILNFACLRGAKKIRL